MEDDAIEDSLGHAIGEKKDGGRPLGVPRHGGAVDLVLDDGEFLKSVGDDVNCSILERENNP